MKVFLSFIAQEQIAASIKCNTYFARPYHFWQLRQNKNANGLLRQYFPKSVELIDVTAKEAFDAVRKLNSRPRKCFGLKTPYEVFEELTGITEKRLTGCALMT